MWVLGRPLIGTVSAFDAHRGLGALDAAEGGLTFHCTAIADGSRVIDVGTVVSFVVVAARAGRVEAHGLLPLDR
jgi:cold shock CspA family protein